MTYTNYNQVINDVIISKKNLFSYFFLVLLLVYNGNIEINRMKKKKKNKNKNSFYRSLTSTNVLINK